MKRTILAIALAASLSITAVSADTGVGVILGEPTGVSVLFNNRIAAAAAWSLDNYLHVHADWWFVNDAFIAPFNWFLGVGGKVRLLGGEDAVRAGARVPVGLQWYVAPRLELFAEVVPGLEVIPETDFDLDAGIGLRFHL